MTLPTVILAFFYGQSRIFFVMARDGLIPPNLARVSGRGSPVRITIFTAIVVAVAATGAVAYVEKMIEDRVADALAALAAAPLEVDARVALAGLAMAATDRRA